MKRNQGTNVEEWWFPHPWETSRLGEWRGTLVLHGAGASGKTRVALEYAIAALIQDAIVVFISETPEERLHQAVRQRVARIQHRGKFITRSGSSRRDLLGHVFNYAQKADLIVLDHGDWPTDVDGTFNELRRVTVERDTSVLITKVGSLGRTALSAADVVIGTRVMRGEIPTTVGQTDEQVVEIVERSLNGMMNYNLCVEKNRFSENGIIYVDAATMRQLGPFQ